MENVSDRRFGVRSVRCCRRSFATCGEGQACRDRFRRSLLRTPSPPFDDRLPGTCGCDGRIPRTHQANQRIGVAGGIGPGLFVSEILTKVDATEYLGERGGFAGRIREGGQGTPCRRGHAGSPLRPLGHAPHPSPRALLRRASPSAIAAAAASICAEPSQAFP